MSRFKVLRVAQVALVLSAGLLVIGCGGADNVANVTGKVTLDGQPVADAVVRFRPVAGNSPSAGITDSSGQYTLKYAREIEGAEIGEHVVSISTFSAGNEDAEPPKPPVAERLPAKYNSQTELKATVKGGSNTLDFPLQSAGPITQPKPDE